jgi:hypothetical protein
MCLLGQFFPQAFLAVAPFFDRESGPEKTALEVECTIPGARLAALRPVPGQPLARAGQTLVLAGHQNYALLRMPGCEVLPLPIPVRAVVDPDPVVAPGGVALYRTMDGTPQWWYAEGVGSAPMKLEAPPHSGTPMLSIDGKWIAWPRHTYGAKPSLLIRKLGGAEEIEFPVNSRFPIPVEVLLLSMDERAVTLFDYAEGFRSLTLDGAVRWGPVTPNSPQYAGTILLAEGVGWLARHVSRADDAWFLPWAPSGKKIDLRVRRGRTLQSCALSPGGGLLAVVSDGQDKTAVDLIRAQDGEQVFRRYLPAGAAVPVAFLGDRFFAYSEAGSVRVLRLP